MKLSSVLAHLPPPTYKHMIHMIQYIYKKHRQKESWHLLMVSCLTVIVYLQNIWTYYCILNITELLLQEPKVQEPELRKHRL